MTAASLIRRLLLCSLALCVSGTGLSASAFRAVGAEAEVQAEEVAVHETARRQGVSRTRQPAPPIPAAAPSRSARLAARAVDSATALPSLRTLNVRTQV